MLCVPEAVILGQSFVRRLFCDLEQQFDDQAKRDFDLDDVNIQYSTVWYWRKDGGKNKTT